MVQFINPQYDNPSKINTRAMWPSTQMTLKSVMLLSGIVVPTREHKINKSTHARLPKKMENLVTVTLDVLPYGAFTLTDW